jgi:uncharacterized tellurite resistance protein B-like protein
MDTPDKNKQLLKILFAAAWIDGVIQKEEREYLQSLAKSQDFSEDSEIKALLAEIKPISPSECYQMLESYLGANPSREDYQALLEALSSLIYKDGDVQTSEAQLLTKLQLLEPSVEAQTTTLDKLLRSIQKLYRQAVEQKS